MTAEYEIVCLDEYGGISRTMSAAFRSVEEAVAAGSARASEHCARILVCAVQTNSILWEGSRDEAVTAAALKAQTGSPATQAQ